MRDILILFMLVSAFLQVTPGRGNREEKENVKFTQELWDGLEFVLFCETTYKWTPVRGCKGRPFAKRVNAPILSLYVNKLWF